MPLGEKRHERVRLDRGAADVVAVYGVLVDYLSQECSLFSQDQFHVFLNREPVVCRSCFRLLKKYSDIRTELEAVKVSISRAFLAAHARKLYFLSYYVTYCRQGMNIIIRMLCLYIYIIAVASRGLR